MATKISISIPDELKRRMDGRSNTNWSRVAAEAFERELSRVNLEAIRRIQLEDLRRETAYASDGRDVLETLLRIVGQGPSASPELIAAIREDLAPVLDRLFEPESSQGIFRLQIPDPPTGQAVGDAIRAAMAGYHEVAKTATNRLIFELVMLRLQLAVERSSRSGA